MSASFPNLVSLGVFVSVVELGSVSKAAAAHHMAQPSASNRLRILERQLGLTLLDRSSSGSIPTAEGSVVAGWAAGVLRAAEQLSAGVAALQAEASGLLRIGASFTVAEYLLPPWLERFVRDRPTDSVSLLVANSASVEGQLNNGLVDLGFIESPHPTPALSSQVVGRDELVVVVAPGHPWSGRPSISLDALASTPLVLRERGSGTRDALIEAFDRLGYPEPVSVLELGSTAAVRAAVMNGSSPTIVSRLTVAADLTTQSLVEIDVPGLSIQRDLRAVWRHGVELSPLAAALLAQLPNL